MCALTQSGFREGMLPNKRLKLTASGRGRNCVCALASLGVSLNRDGAGGGRRRSLSAIR